MKQLKTKEINTVDLSDLSVFEAMKSIMHISVNNYGKNVCFKVANAGIKSLLSDISYKSVNIELI